jgi:hypothetical protein
LEEKKEWVDSSPTKVSDIDERTEQVSVQLTHKFRKGCQVWFSSRSAFSRFIVPSKWLNSVPLTVLLETLQVVVHDAEAYSYDEEILKKAEAMGRPGLVEIISREDSFIFTVESTGAITLAQMFLNAIEILKNKLDSVRLSFDTEEPDDQFGELGAHIRVGVI